MQAVRARRLLLPPPPAAARSLLRAAPGQTPPLAAVVAHLPGARAPQAAVDWAGRTASSPVLWDEAAERQLALAHRHLAPRRVAPAEWAGRLAAAASWPELRAMAACWPATDQSRPPPAAVDAVIDAIEGDELTVEAMAAGPALALGRWLLGHLSGQETLPPIIALAAAARGLGARHGARMVDVVVCPELAADGRLESLTALCQQATDLDDAAARRLQALITTRGEAPERAAPAGHQDAALRRARLRMRLEQARVSPSAQGCSGADLHAALGRLVCSTQNIHPPSAELQLALGAVCDAWDAAGAGAASIGALARSLSTGAQAGRALSPAGLARAMAAVCAQMSRSLGVTPYPMQILAALALVVPAADRCGRLAQMRTGEGKSTVVALAAGLHALLGRAVDIVSSSRPLAVRDQRRFALFFATLGLETAHICDDAVAPDTFRAAILFGTGPDFEWALLRDRLSRDRQRPYGRDCAGTRPQDVAIVDEVDNLFLDRGDNPSVISAVSADPGRAMITPMYTFAAARGAAAGRIGQEDIAHFRQGLAAGSLPARAAAAVDDTCLLTWMQSCRRALFELREGHDYVVESTERMPTRGPDGMSGCITIIEAATGQRQPDSRWSRRMHQFVEMKHGLEVRSEGASAAQIRHADYFGRYGLLFGLTGTLGSAVERAELAEAFSVDTLDIVSHRPSRRAPTHGPQIWPTTSAKYAAVVREARQAAVEGRPCLVLCASIAQSVETEARLRAAGASPQLLNALQPEAEEVIVARAGWPGALTVGTHVAGRGTDIGLSTEVVARGGLHVVLAFFADSQRIEEQAIGRAARQGQAGSYAIVLGPLDTEPVCGPLPPSPAALEQGRDRAEQERSQMRRAAMAHSSIQARIEEDFAQRLQAWQVASAPQHLGERVAQRSAPGPAHVDAAAARHRLGDWLTDIVDALPRGRTIADALPLLRGAVRAIDEALSAAWSEVQMDLDLLMDAPLDPASAVQHENDVDGLAHRLDADGLQARLLGRTRGVLLAPAEALEDVLCMLTSRILAEPEP